VQCTFGLLINGSLVPYDVFFFSPSAMHLK